MYPYNLAKRCAEKTKWVIVAQVSLGGEGELLQLLYAFDVERLDAE